MKLENQVTSLKDSKELKKLGVPPYSLFYWREVGVVGKEEWYVSNDEWDRESNDFPNEPIYPAYTVLELVDMIPMTYFLIEQHSNDYRVGIQGKSDYFSSRSLIEALTKLVIKIYSKK